MYGDVEPFGLIIVTDPQWRNRADDPDDNDAADDGPGRYGNRAERLHAKLAAGVHTVGQSEPAKGRQGKDRNQQGASQAADTVDGKDIKRIVDLEALLDHVNHQIANYASRDADD